MDRLGENGTEACEAVVIFRKFAARTESWPKFGEMRLLKHLKTRQNEIKAVALPDNGRRLEKSLPASNPRWRLYCRELQTFRIPRVRIVKRIG